MHRIIRKYQWGSTIVSPYDPNNTNNTWYNTISNYGAASATQTINKGPLYTALGNYGASKAASLATQVQPLQQVLPYPEITSTIKDANGYSTNLMNGKLTAPKQSSSGGNISGLSQVGNALLPYADNALNTTASLIGGRQADEESTGERVFGGAAHAALAAGIQSGNPYAIGAGALLTGLDAFNTHFGKTAHTQGTSDMSIYGFDTDQSLGAGKKTTWLHRNDANKYNRVTDAANQANIEKQGISLTASQNNIAAQNSASDIYQRNYNQLYGLNNTRILAAKHGVKFPKPDVKMPERDKNVIPEGALHARLNDMEKKNPDLDITNKGIPVVAQEGTKIKQQAEIEKNEIIFTKHVTEELETLKKQSEEHEKDDEYAIAAGKLLVREIFDNTEDNTGLIKETIQKKKEGGTIDKGNNIQGIAIEDKPDIPKDKEDAAETLLKNSNVGFINNIGLKHSKLEWDYFDDKPGVFSMVQSINGSIVNFSDKDRYPKNTQKEEMFLAASRSAKEHNDYIPMEQDEADYIVKKYNKDNLVAKDQNGGIINGGILPNVTVHGDNTDNARATDISKQYVQDLWNAAKNVKPTGSTINSNELDTNPITTPEILDALNRVQNSKANFVSRLNEKNPQLLHGLWDNANEVGNQKMGYDEDEDGNTIVFPMIQHMPDGTLKDFTDPKYYNGLTGDKLRNATFDAGRNNALKNNDYVIMPQREAAWFSNNNYKTFFPAYQQYFPVPFQILFLLILQKHFLFL